MPSTRIAFELLSKPLQPVSPIHITTRSVDGARVDEASVVSPASQRKEPRLAQPLQVPVSQSVQWRPEHLALWRPEHLAL